MYQGKHSRPVRLRRSLMVLALVCATALVWLSVAEFHGEKGAVVAAALKPRVGVPVANTGTAPTPLPRLAPVSLAPASAIDAAIARLAQRGVPIYCGGPSKPFVALTFDDGPGPFTLGTMTILRSFGDTATFFLVGKELRAYPALLDVPRLERQLGAIGDHTWNHLYLPGLDVTRLHHEIADAERAIAAASGGRVQVFRPPYGARNATVDAYVRSLGMVEVIWTVDSGDSHGASASQVVANVVKGLRPGAIILLHENRGSTYSVLPQILQAIRERGLQTVTLPTLLALDPPTLTELQHPGYCPR